MSAIALLPAVHIHLAHNMNLLTTAPSQDTWDAICAAFAGACYVLDSPSPVTPFWHYRLFHPGGHVPAINWWRFALSSQAMDAPACPVLGFHRAALLGT